MVGTNDIISKPRLMRVGSFSVCLFLHWLEIKPENIKIEKVMIAIKNKSKTKFQILMLETNLPFQTLTMPG